MKKSTPEKSNHDNKLAPIKPVKKGFLPWCWRWLISPFLTLFISFHLLVAIMLAVWAYFPVSNSMFMISHRLSGGSVTQTWVDYDKIATGVKQAAIASEDAKFSHHHGFDWQGIEIAAKANDKKGKISKGGSTISQQLAKNLFLYKKRSYIRKAEEAILTVMTETFWEKRRILEVYLNVVEFGNGIYGIEAAAQHYYGKSAKQLNRQQSARLISMLPNPKFYEKNLQSKRLRNKQTIILGRMNSAVLPQ